jgi:hypothetical protein
MEKAMRFIVPEKNHGPARSSLSEGNLISPVFTCDPQMMMKWVYEVQQRQFSGKHCYGLEI